jgi:hypothetical protein
MNKQLLFEWVLKNLESNYSPENSGKSDRSTSTSNLWFLWRNRLLRGSQYPPKEVEGLKLQEALYELNNRREVDLPSSLPKKPEQMIPVLREHFKDDVTFISLVLNYHFPEQYFFYRVSKLEPEIFLGFQFFSEVSYHRQNPAQLRRAARFWRRCRLLYRRPGPGTLQHPGGGVQPVDGPGHALQRRVCPRPGLGNQRPAG